MNYRLLGRTGLSCSEIALGTWAFASTAYGDVTVKEAHTTIHAALDAGINLFDTAPLYGTAENDGRAEEILGEGLGARRDEILIASKFGRTPSIDGCAPHFDGTTARLSVEASLRRLKTDRIDVLFFHSPFHPSEIHDDVWESLDALRASGKVRFLGHSVSNIPATGDMAIRWVRENRSDVVQLVLNLLNREASPLIAELHAAGAGIVARECLANGWLAGNFNEKTVFPPNNLNGRYSPEELAARTQAVEQLRFLVKGEISTLAQAALRWVIQYPGIHTTLVGARTPGELQDAIRASTKAEISAADWQRASDLSDKDFAAA